MKTITKTMILTFMMMLNLFACFYGDFELYEITIDEKPCIFGYHNSDYRESAVLTCDWNTNFMLNTSNMQII